MLLIVTGHWMACIFVMLAELEGPCYRVMEVNCYDGDDDGDDLAWLGADDTSSRCCCVG